ncbi:MAG: sialidase family protein, partial [Acidobacteriota bacterium]|nr:sialidase family protein [Acidobacteriota bacterium]
MKGLTAFFLLSCCGMVGFGQSFTDTELLNTNATSDSGDDEKPRLAADGHGNWMAVWHSDDTLDGSIGGDFDVLFAVSTDDGVTWTDPAPVHAGAAADSGDDLWPDVKARGEASWLVVWESRTDFSGSMGTDADLVFSLTADNGANWSTPAALNSSATVDTTESEYLPRIETNGAGVWVAVFLSNNDFGMYDGDNDLFFTRSTDNGMTWSAMAILNSMAATDHSSNDDDNQQVATDGMGNWVTVWDQKPFFGSDSEVYFSRSTDNGVTWSNAAALNDTAGDLGNDLVPSVATDGGGNWVCVWETV